MFRFTIRDVLWLTVVAAVVVAWWVDRFQLSRRMGKLAAANSAMEKELHELQFYRDNKHLLLTPSERWEARPILDR